MHTAERDAHVNAIRADHETHAAKDKQTAGRHRQLAAIWRALEAKAAKESEMFAAVQATRRQWETVTETTRTIAIAADAELRRRHPSMWIEPLHPHPTEGDSITRPVDPEPVPRGRHAASSQPDISSQLALGLTLQVAQDEIPAQVLRIRKNARIVQAKLDDLASLPLPAADDRSPGLAWPAQPGHDREAVLQPPRPDVVPSARVVEHHRPAQRASGHSEPEPG